MRFNNVNSSVNLATGIGNRASQTVGSAQR
ncbi:hypothetical protein J2850_004840 [Azospirillum picis]|uniref:Flagellin n=1 Tax=Azospirillum picis TaxID=488438 RepID=A0ABU0MQ50_9PROT|nr:hypothetical protein [Azospirillum picis]MDQ0535600.1 hypothetical protein [Azospirillum picis]